MSTMIDGVWIKKFVTPELLEKIRNADFVELHLETNDGKVGEDTGTFIQVLYLVDQTLRD